MAGGVLLMKPGATFAAAGSRNVVLQLMANSSMVPNPAAMAAARLARTVRSARQACTASRARASMKAPVKPRAEPTR